MHQALKDGMCSQEMVLLLVLKMPGIFTIDLFESMADANKVWWSEIPQKINESNTKKYGSVSDLRVIQHRVVTRLLFDAKNGKKKINL